MYTLEYVVVLASAVTNKTVDAKTWQTNSLPHYVCDVVGRQNRFSNNCYFYTLSPLTGGGFTSAVAFATVEVKRPGDKGMLPIACSSGRFTSAVANATVEVK